MNEWGWIVAGGAALTGVITMCWGYVRNLWSQISSRVVVSCEIKAELVDAITMYCWRHMTPSRFGCRSFIGWNLFVRPTKRIQLVAMEAIGQNRLCWKRWRPLWISYTKTKDPGPNSAMTITFLRGLFNLDELIVAAVQECNRVRAATDDTEHSRYYVKHIYGSAHVGSNRIRDKSEIDAPPTVACGSDSSSGPRVWQMHRVLQWKHDELGESKMNHGSALDQMALSSECEAMVEEIRRWKSSEEWYKSRCIPWRRGWLLHGPTGTGKTSLIRAMAEDFDLPIFVYDLATLRNDELQCCWRNMLGYVPCIALIEDVDTVFEGRKNVANGELTFDCLLNCLDGVEQADGVILALTTNRIEKLDPSLGIPVGQSSIAQISTRPGRVDQILEMRELDEMGRRKLCKRILEQWPDEWEHVVTDGVNETGAQFQERCTRLALALYWSAK